MKGPTDKCGIIDIIARSVHDLHRSCRGLPRHSLRFSAYPRGYTWAPLTSNPTELWQALRHTEIECGWSHRFVARPFRNGILKSHRPCADGFIYYAINIHPQPYPNTPYTSKSKPDTSQHRNDNRSRTIKVELIDNQVMRQLKAIRKYGTQRKSNDPNKTFCQCTTDGKGKGRREEEPTPRSTAVYMKKKSKNRKKQHGNRRSQELEVGKRETGCTRP